METIRIEIGFDLYKELTMLRSDPDTTYDQVIRELLESHKNKSVGVQSNKITSKPKTVIEGKGWFYGKVFFPEGTKFRASYKGTLYTGEVANGALSFDGKRFDSPSGAAVHITKNMVNGWRFWECLRPNDTTWRSIDSLRRHK